MKNKLVHTLFLVVFAIACKWLSDFLALAAKVSPDGRLLVSGAPLRLIVIIMPMLAAAYCLWIWFRKADRLPSWTSFCATTTSALVLLLVPTLFAVYLPVINDLDRLKASRPTIGAGQIAPLFEAEKIDGGTANFPSDYKGKIVLLDFWATWCVPCRAEIPNVVAAYQRYHTNGFELLSVSLDRPGERSTVLRYIQDHAMNWSHVYDGGVWKSPLALKYGVHSVPCPVLIDGDTGVIVAEGPDVIGPGLQSLLETMLKAKRSK